MRNDLKEAMFLLAHVVTGFHLLVFWICLRLLCIMAARHGGKELVTAQYMISRIGKEEGVLFTFQDFLLS